jgi:uncharacterized membrane protein
MSKMAKFKSALLALFILIVMSLINGTHVLAQTPSNSLPYYRAKVVKVLEERQIPSQDSALLYTQRLQVERLDNKETIELEIGTTYAPLNADQRLKVGTKVILSEQTNQSGVSEYVLVDIYRLPLLGWFGMGFFFLVILVARKQGFFSIIGMLVSLFILSGFIVPHIMAGQNPVLITIIGSIGIAALTMYLSHGWRTNSHLSLLAMLISLIAVGILATLVVNLVHLVGLGSEEAYFLQFGPWANINLKGLLLGGIILGALGILDDITVSQVSIVRQLFEVNPNLSFSELYERGLNVGRDHVASLVNTLVLAYAGANLPLFILFSASSVIPPWVNINNEVISEEIVRTIVGSTGLVLAVPLSTLLAAFWFKKTQSLNKKRVQIAQAHSPTPIKKTKKRV